MIVKKFIKAIEMRFYGKAYSLFSERLRSVHSMNQLVQEANALDFSMYKLLGGYCMEVDQVGNDGSVDISLGLGCFVSLSGNPVEALVLRVVPANGHTLPSQIDEFTIKELKRIR
jgi:hypothetical protein